MSDPIVSQPEHGDIIGFVDDKPVVASDRFQLYLDDIAQKLNQNLLGNQVVLQSYTVATLPPVTENGWIHVTDETGGPVAAYSNSTNWLRASDGAIVS